MGTSTRSNPATHTGVMDDVRKAFAAANKVDAGLFSFNSKGACETCKGAGVLYTDLAFLDGVKTPCEICQGRRFKDEVLAYTLNGKSISDVLALTVAQALDFFTQRETVRKLQAMSDVGLEYLTLGQPLRTPRPRVSRPASTGTCSFRGRNSPGPPRARCPVAVLRGAVAVFSLQPPRGTPPVHPS